MAWHMYNLQCLPVRSVIDGARSGDRLHNTWIEVVENNMLVVLSNRVD